MPRSETDRTPPPRKVNTHGVGPAPRLGIGQANSAVRGPRTSGRLPGHKQGWDTLRDSRLSHHNASSSGVDSKRPCPSSAGQPAVQKPPESEWGRPPTTGHIRRSGRTCAIEGRWDRSRTPPPQHPPASPHPNRQDGTTTGTYPEARAPWAQDRPSRRQGPGAPSS